MTKKQKAPERPYAADNDSRGGTFLHDGTGRIHESDLTAELIAEIEAEAAEQREAVARLNAAAAAKQKEGDA